MPEETAFFFGTYTHVGHGAWDDRWRRVRYADLCMVWGGDVDGDKTYPSEREGEAAVYHQNGYTLLGFADRTVDSRRGSHAAFVLPGTLTYDDAERAARAAFPHVWERFSFEVRPVSVSERSDDA